VSVPTTLPPGSRAVVDGPAGGWNGGIADPGGDSAGFGGRVGCPMADAMMSAMLLIASTNVNLMVVAVVGMS
jgi:hypothetical protein